MTLNPSDLDDLRTAWRRVSHPSYFTRAIAVVGKPIDRATAALPAKAQDVIQGAVHASLEKALQIALGTLPERRPKAASNWLHRAAVVGTGVLGGAAGFAGLAVELPVSTGVMLRSIADIARAHGESLDDPATQLECLSVFALGGQGTRSDDAAESSYFIVRAALARELALAAKYLAAKGASAKVAAPALVRLLQSIGARFQVVVAEKAALQAVPLLGAATAAALNYGFMDHFQDVANGHFRIRALEREHGVEVVRSAIEQLGA